jgi:hypothetical protein
MERDIGNGFSTTEKEKSFVESSPGVLGTEKDSQGPQWMKTQRG